MHARVLWAVIIGFLGGVALRSIVSLSWPFAVFLIVLAVLALGVYLRDKREAYLLVAVILMFFGAGILRTSSVVQIGDPLLTAAVEKSVVISGRVVAEPDIRENGVRLTIAADSLGATSSRPVRARVLVLAQPHTEAAYGDEIRATGTLKLPEAFDTGTGRSFNYPLYLAKNGVLYQLAFARVETTGERGGNLIQKAAIGLKQAYLHGLGAVLPEPEAGFAGGITVGDKRSIGSALSATFQKVSLIHMVVLSGYNITVVINSAARFLAFAGRSVQFGGSAVVVIFFILMAGGAASAVRAGAMALLAMYARVSGRTFVALRALGATCFVMVLWNPYTLLFDPSFQLSALATVGLVLFTPPFFNRLIWIPERFGLREIVASTLGTQLAVLPLLLYQNGNLSLVALPANLFALIPVPFAMAASFLAAIGGMVFGSYAIVLAFPAYVVLAYIIKVAEFFASVPFASVAVPAFSAWWMIAAYALLGFGYLYIQKKTAGTSPAA